MSSNKQGKKTRCQGPTANFSTHTQKKKEYPVEAWHPAKANQGKYAVLSSGEIISVVSRIFAFPGVGAVAARVIFHFAYIVLTAVERK